jgi:hypothetical protein
LVVTIGRDDWALVLGLIVDEQPDKRPFTF